jgi:hypothetical protein
MIVSRAPVRFSLGGGGTDLLGCSREHGGSLVAAAIDKDETRPLLLDGKIDRYGELSHEQRRMSEAMVARGLRPLCFRFDLDGARILANVHRS